VLRTNSRRAAMPHEGTSPAAVLNGRARKPDTPHPPKLALPSFDFTKPLAWTEDRWATEFHELVKNPPLHSVVIEIAPKVAEQLLNLSNTKNRPKQKKHSQKLGSALASDDYEITGDTIKFSKTGVLLDGQHRLDGCIKGKKPIVSHVVFGLDDEVFDVIDQGKKRTAGDILALCGVPEPIMVAGAVGWVLRLEAGEGHALGGGTIWQRGELTPRKIKEMALGRMKGIIDYAKDARLINVAFKDYRHPPTMICAILYLIGKRDPALARDFAHEWVHGARTGRNKNFDVLNQRIMAIANANNGLVNRAMRAALVTQMFNYWNAHVVASPRALTWRKGWTFPTLEFDIERFKAGKAVQDRENTSLHAVKYRVHYVLTEMRDKHCETNISSDRIAELANVSPGSVSYILGELVKGGQIKKISDGKNGKPATYSVMVPAVEVSKAET
jgi:hypothetical protein